VEPEQRLKTGPGLELRWLKSFKRSGLFHNFIRFFIILGVVHLTHPLVAYTPPFGYGQSLLKNCLFNRTLMGNSLWFKIQIPAAA
jgi:hypothetical protein